jgi:hypothetical protein
MGRQRTEDAYPWEAPDDGSMTAVRRLAITVSLVLIAAGGLLSASAGPATADGGGTVRPIVDCVFHDTGTGQYNAVWGYTNQTSSTVTLAIGGANNFAPAPSDRGQGTAFAPGQHDNVLVVSWAGTSDLVWTLNGRSETASIHSQACGTNPVPIAGSQTLTWIVLAVAFVGTAAIVARRTRRDPRGSTPTR